MYVKHGLIYLLSNIAPALASFLTIAAYTRWLSPVDYGVYTTILVFASSLNGFLFGWLNIGIMRFWNARDISAETMQHLLSFSVVGISSIVGLLAVAYSLLFGHTAIALSFFVLFASTVLYESYQRVNTITQQASQYLWVELSRTLLTLVIGLLLVWLGYSWFGAMGGITLGIFLTLLFAGGMKRYLHVSWREVDITLLKKILLYGLPLSLSTVLLDVIYTSDRLLLGLLASYSAAGQYAVAYNVPHQIILMLFSSLNLAAYPIIVYTLEHEGKAQAEEKFKQYFLVLMAGALPAAIGLVGISHSFFPLLLGGKFVDSSIRLLPWICVAVLGHCLYSFYIFMSFQLANRTYDAVKVGILGAIVNLPLNMILIPKFGVIGAASASASAYILCVLYGYYLNRTNFNLIIPWRELFKVVVASFTMLLLMKYIPDSPNMLTIIHKIITGITIYASIVLFLNIGDIHTHLKNMGNIFSTKHAKEI
jgi:O-antigen/teichoic acid export membrane protein